MYKDIRWVKDFVSETTEGKFQAWDETQANSLGVFDNPVEAVKAVLDRANEIEIEDAEDAEEAIVGNPKARHYDAGGIQVMDVIRAKLTEQQFKGYLLGSIMKYSLRANFKCAFKSDCEKMEDFARWLNIVNSKEERGHDA